MSQHTRYTPTRLLEKKEETHAISLTVARWVVGRVVGTVVGRVVGCEFGFIEGVVSAYRRLCGLVLLPGMQRRRVDLS